MSVVEIVRKRQLAERLSAKTGAKLKTSAAVVDFLIDEMALSLAKGHKVNIKDFGIFAKVNRSARMGRNPLTGEQIKIKASVKARFTASKALKEAMAGKKYAPHADLSKLEACACGAKPAAKAAVPAKLAAKPAAKSAAKAVARPVVKAAAKPVAKARPTPKAIGKKPAAKAAPKKAVKKPAGRR